MKRFLLAAFLTVVGLCAAKAVPKIKPFFFVEEGQCSKYEYPAQELDYNGRKVRMDAAVVYKASEDGKGYDFINLTLRFSPVGAKGFTENILDSISRLGRCNTVVERVEYNSKGATAVFKGEACMFSESFSMLAHNEEAKAVAKYKVRFNAYDPAKSSLACEITGKEWDKADGVVVGCDSVPPGGLFDAWRVDLHDAGRMSGSRYVSHSPARISVDMSLSQPARYRNPAVFDPATARYSDRLCLRIHLLRSLYDDETGENRGGGRSITFEDGYLGEPPYFRKYAVGKKGTGEITVEETAPMEVDLPFIDWRFPAGMDYRIYMKGPYLDGMYNSRTLYIREAVFTCLFHNYGYPPVDDLDWLWD